jgi:hypothetical protein
MPQWTIFDYVDPSEGNLIRTWAMRLQRKERAKLNQKLDSLSLHGPDLIPGVLSPTGVPAIFKLRVRGQVQLRPMLCEGPWGRIKEYTLLMGAVEKSADYVPKNAPLLAAKIRELLISDAKRRTPHERVD